MLFHLIRLGCALLLSAAIVYLIVENVDEVITKANLPQLIRRALGNSKEDEVKKLLAKALRGKINGLDGNTISIGLLEQDGTEVSQVKLTGKAISEELTVGMIIE